MLIVYQHELQPGDMWDNGLRGVRILGNNRRGWSNSTPLLVMECFAASPINSQNQDTSASVIPNILYMREKHFWGINWVLHTEMTFQSTLSDTDALDHCCLILSEHRVDSGRCPPLESSKHWYSERSLWQPPVADNRCGTVATFIVGFTLSPAFDVRCHEMLLEEKMILAAAAAWRDEISQPPCDRYNSNSWLDDLSFEDRGFCK